MVAAWSGLTPIRAFPVRASFYCGGDHKSFFRGAFLGRNSSPSLNRKSGTELGVLSS